MYIVRRNVMKSRFKKTVCTGVHVHVRILLWITTVNGTKTCSCMYAYGTCKIDIDKGTLIANLLVFVC